MKAANATNGNGEGTRKHLHLVDDERLVLATLEQGLSCMGYRVTVSESASQFFDSIENDMPDLAILDMRLREASGMDIARRIEAEYQVPFIFLTAFADADLVAKATAMGALGYMVKPVEIEALIPTIESALARSMDIRALQTAQENLSKALEQGRDVSVAIGILMERHRIDRDTAYTELRQSARSQRRQLEALAGELLGCAEALNVGGSNPKN